MNLDPFSFLVGWMGGGLSATLFFMIWSARRLLRRQRERSD